MAGVAITIILLAMGSSWIIRGLLLRQLRDRFPDEFAALGYPSRRQLESMLPRYQELHIRFWKYLWGGKVFLVNDKLVSSLAGAALLADIALAGGALVLLWSAGK
jgi:hypothetical protein